VKVIDGKFSCDGNRIINVNTSEPIPDDEPVFLLRAKDKAAIRALSEYGVECTRIGSPQTHLDAIADRIADFAIWQADHKPTLKVPD
jgi:hypothetical protein